MAAMRTEADAALLGIAFLGVKDIYSADNSSPQTTELNAKKRAPTLMKWVNIAAVESAGVVVLLTAAAPPGHKRWPLFGGVPTTSTSTQNNVACVQWRMERKNTLQARHPDPTHME